MRARSKLFVAVRPLNRPCHWHLMALQVPPACKPIMFIDLPGNAELFHTDDGAAFADLIIDGHRETWPVRSARFRSWLRRKHYEATGQAADYAAISSALNVLEARAQFDGPQRPVYLRVAEQDGRIYLDLADESWHAVEIGPASWQVMSSPPVRFRRTAGMLPLISPKSAGGQRGRSGASSSSHARKYSVLSSTRRHMDCET
jgi:hypothetical protein